MGEAAVAEAALLGQRDQLLDVGPKLLRLGGGGGDLLVLDQRGGHVAEQGGAVARGALQLAAADVDFISILSIFVLACFVGYFVVWSVTPALHTPLMSVTNAISSVIVVGALIAAAAAGARRRNGSGWSRSRWPA
jgi:hypothetical protein